MITQLKPPAHLSPFIECIWLYSSKEPYQGFPQGVFDLIFSPNAFKYRNQVTNHVENITAGKALVGIHAQGFELASASSNMFVGVRLKAFALFCAGRVDTDSVSSGCKPLDELGIASPSLDHVFSRVASQTHATVQLQQASQVLIPWLEKCFYPLQQFDYQSFRALTNVLLMNRGNIQINTVCDEFKLSKVTLRKHFLKYAGVTPKEMCQIWQINQLFVTASNADNWNVVDLALSAGYYDQAHLTHRFKHAFGTTPKRFFASVNQSQLAQAGLMHARFVGDYDPF